MPAGFTCARRLSAGQSLCAILGWYGGRVVGAMTQTSYTCLGGGGRTHLAAGEAELAVVVAAGG